MLVPQIVEGDRPLGLLTEKVSVRHCVAGVASTPCPVACSGWPLRISVLVTVVVDGPEITNVLKSSRS